MQPVSSFRFDIFLSYGEKDKPVVRSLAERLRNDGLKVWFDEWEIKPDDDRPARLAEGLEQARILVLCASRNAFSDNWAKLESTAIRLRDQRRNGRRFFLLQLDDASVEHTLSEFLHIDWRPRRRGKAYWQLLDLCSYVVWGHPSEALLDEAPEGRAAPEYAGLKSQSLSYWANSSIVAFTRDFGRVLVSEGRDAHVWDLKRLRTIAVLQGHTANVTAVLWCPDDRCAVTGANDGEIRVWNVADATCSRILKAHTGRVQSLAWNDRLQCILSGGDDPTARIWNLRTGETMGLLNGRPGLIRCVAWSQDDGGLKAVTGGDDGIVRIWDALSGKLLRKLELHKTQRPIAITSLACRRQNHQVFAGSRDGVIRLWDQAKGRLVASFEGHTDAITALAESPNGLALLSGSSDGKILAWDIRRGLLRESRSENSAGILQLGWNREGTAVWALQDDAGTGRTFREWNIAESSIASKSPPFSHANARNEPFPEVQYLDIDQAIQPSWQTNQRPLSPPTPAKLASRRKEKLLTLEVGARITSANQKWWEIPQTEDEGIDMILEFTDEKGNGMGRELRLQLKAGNFHLTRRKRDGAEIFKIKKPRWVDTWTKQPFPVMLVIGEFHEDEIPVPGKERIEFANVRWMEITSVLENLKKSGPDEITQIKFEGEPLTQASILHWREKLCAPQANPEEKSPQTVARKRNYYSTSRTSPFTGE